MNFGGIVHVHQYPSKRWGYVGSVPASLLDWVKPTAADAMAGRVHNGKAWKNRTFDTCADAVTEARRVNANLCSIPTCACRKEY